jgi:hypothetical protein
MKEKKKHSNSVFDLGITNDELVKIDVNQKIVLFLNIFFYLII